jgi:hypothetical protein
MRNFLGHLDIVSHVVIVITFVLFVAALFVKGFGHGLLLEAGVFLVSVKLIMMAHKNSILAKDLSERLDRMEATLSRLEQRFEAHRPPDLASHPAENEMR